MFSARLALALSLSVLFACGADASGSAPSEASPATLLGSRDANPPSESLEGLRLTGQVFSAGEALRWEVAFGAGDTDAAAIASTITSATAPVLYATDEGSRIRLTTAETGEDVVLYAFADEAGAVLGFSEATGATGE